MTKTDNTPRSTFSIWAQACRMPFLTASILPVLLAFPLKGLRLQLGFARYHLLMQLALWMALVPIKMVFRWTLNLKYIVAITEWFFNV